MSKGQRIRLGSRSRRFRGFENRIAREHLVAIAPPERVLDGERIDVPAVVVPVHVDRAKHSILVLDVEDVGVAVVPLTASKARWGLRLPLLNISHIDLLRMESPIGIETPT